MPDDVRRAVTFAGRCSIVSIEDNHRQLLDAVHAGESITVDLSEVESADVSFLQLLVSARHMAAAQNKSFTLRNLPAPIAAAFRAAGVSAEQLSAPLPAS